MKKLFFLIFIFSIQLFGQEKDHEMKSEVKALTEFHEVIYQIWHTGWPEKNIEFLSSLLPDVEKLAAEVIKAELPGILRDKKIKWDEGIKNFGSSVSEFKNAVEHKDSVRILNAAEKLHTQYEFLVRTIRPVLKEVDSFHQVLYMLYHYHLPNYEFEKIKTSAKEMISKMEKLNNVQLPAKIKQRQDNFDKAKLELEIAVKKLNDVLEQGEDRKTIESAVNLVHSKYEELEKVFN